MAHHFTPVPTKTYATEANAVKAVEKVYGPDASFAEGPVYVVMRTPEGRFYPLFIGQRALQAMAHAHFNVVA